MISIRDFQITISDIPQLRWNSLLYRYSIQPFACSKNNVWNTCSIRLKYIAYRKQHTSTESVVQIDMFPQCF